MSARYDIDGIIARYRAQLGAGSPAVPTTTIGSPGSISGIAAASYAGNVAAPAYAAQGSIANAIQQAQPAAAVTGGLTADTSPEQARHMPQAVYDDSKYGNVIEQSITLAANTDTVILTRPSTKRTYLIVVNTGATAVYIGFDSQASISGMPIGAGGNYLCDAFVPQNDIHLLSVAGGSVTLIYSNADTQAPVASETTSSASMLTAAATSAIAQGMLMVGTSL